MKIKFIVVCIFLLLLSSFFPTTISNELASNHEISFKLKLSENNLLRSPAEFELVDELIISWPKDDSWSDELSDIEFYFIDLVKYSEDAVSVNIIVDSLIMQSNIEFILQNNDISLDNVTFTIIPTNSIWIRDYGPFFIEENGELSIVDINYLTHFWSVVGYIYYLLYGHVYNIQDFCRIQDNLFPIRYAKEYDFNYDFLFFYTVMGGNYMSDGQGYGFVGDVLYGENPFLSNYQVENRLIKLLGLDELIILESQIVQQEDGGDGTGHIDMFSKIIDKDTILVGQWNPDDPNYLIVEENVLIFENLGYDVVRIPMMRNPNDPDDYNNKTIWSYTNSLIINGTNKNIVLLPIYGIPEDDIAISIYEQLMPDYEIRCIMSDYIIEFCGAIHCTTITRPLVN